MKKLLLFVSSAFLLTACVTTKQVPEVMVYINTGAIQCELEGQTGKQTSRLLTDNNIEVSKTQCGQRTNIAVASVCGASTVNINVHTIPLNKLASAQNLGYENVDKLKTKDDLGYQAGVCQ